MRFYRAMLCRRRARYYYWVHVPGRVLSSKRRPTSM